jgi:Fic family protein
MDVMNPTYQPPYTITPEILNRVAGISEAIGRLTVLTDPAKALRLRRVNRIRTIQGSLAIEGNTLSEMQITAILDGKRVIAPPREVQEVKNALAAYDALQESTRRTDSTPFIAFMLRMILDAILLPAPEVTPEVRLLMALSGEMTRRQLREALGLKDDEHFRKSYLLPALEAGLIEMTVPDKPRSSKQKYRLTGMGRKRLSRLGEE